MYKFWVVSQLTLSSLQGLNVPVLGLIENMSYFIAPDTKIRYDIFGTGGDTWQRVGHDRGCGRGMEENPRNR